jgi:hypothetical protein
MPSVLSSLDSYLSGLDTTSVRLKLGDFQFQNFEIPEKIAFPGKQQVAVHKLIGGRKVVDVLGVVYDQLSWSGIITGSSAADRVKALELIRDTGKAVTMTLDDVSFSVIVTGFTPVYEFQYRRPYSIELEVIKRNDAPSQTDALTSSLNALINSDVGKSLGLADTINVSSITSAVASVQSAVKSVSDFAHATAETVQTVLTPIQAARTLIHSQILSLESSLSSITSLGGVVPGNPVSKTVSNLLSQANSVTSLSALYSLHTTTGRIEKNVSAGLTADGVKTITVSGGSLYRVAATQYGDPTLWSAIASANGLTDPQLSGIQTLVIPANPSGDDS